MKHLICLLLLGIGGAAAAVAENSPTPRTVIADTIDRVVKVVEAMPGDDQKKARHVKLRAIIAPRFDFKEMSKRSLGLIWNSRTPEERDEFVKLFSDLLATTYLNRIDSIQRKTVKIDKEKVVGDRAVVNTMVTHKGSKFPIDYKMLLRGPGDWQVYDVSIENIGLVVNYRSEFAGIIRKHEFSGLMTKLREKTLGMGISSTEQDR